MKKTLLVLLISSVIMALLKMCSNFDNDTAAYVSSFTNDTYPGYWILLFCLGLSLLAMFIGQVSNKKFLFVLGTLLVLIALANTAWLYRNAYFSLDEVSLHKALDPKVQNGIELAFVKSKLDFLSKTQIKGDVRFRQMIGAALSGSNSNIGEISAALFKKAIIIDAGAIFVGIIGFCIGVIMLASLATYRFVGNPASTFKAVSVGIFYAVLSVSLVIFVPRWFFEATNSNFFVLCAILIIPCLVAYIKTNSARVVQP